MNASLPNRTPACLPERAGGSLKAGIRKPDPASSGDVRKPDNRIARRAVLGAALYDALVILRITRLKQQAEFLRRDPRTLRRWFDGLEPIPWEELLTIRDLQFPLMQALLESCQRDLVEIRTSISQRAQRRVGGLTEAAL